MICVIALIVFSILGIFSASHRQVAKEAMDCVFRRVTLRACNSGLDQRLKGQILGKLLNRSVTAARFVNPYFEVFSWALLLIMIWSTIVSVQSAYNFYMYGNCNGPSSSGFCVFDPSGENSKISALNTECSPEAKSEASLIQGSLILENFPTLKTGSQNTLVFIGCYSCEFTRKTYPVIKQLYEKYKPNVTFAHFPVKPETEYLSNYSYCVNKLNPEKFWQFNDQLFTTPPEKLVDKANTDRIVAELGIDTASVSACVNDSKTLSAVEDREGQISATGIYGTPTTFVNGQALVGPKPTRIYERLLGEDVFAKAGKWITSRMSR